jgi:hypothetical protein
MRMETTPMSGSHRTVHRSPNLAFSLGRQGTPANQSVMDVYEGYIEVGFKDYRSNIYIYVSMCIIMYRLSIVKKVNKFIEIYQGHLQRVDGAIYRQA